MRLARSQNVWVKDHLPFYFYCTACKKNFPRNLRRKLTGWRIVPCCRESHPMELLIRDFQEWLAENVFLSTEDRRRLVLKTGPRLTKGWVGATNIVKGVKI